MAICFPTTLDSIDFDPTPGEKIVFDILHQLGNGCFVWYEIVLQERNFKPDFMLLDPDRGVCIVEVKDWSADAIINANSKQFTIKWRNNPSQPRPNPEVKCKNYVRFAKDKLSLSSELTDTYGQLVIPINYFIALPNFRRKEFDRIELHKVIDPAHVLFKEDLNAPHFQERLQSLMPLCEPPIEISQIRAIRRTLREEVEVSIPIQSSETGLVQAATSVVVDEDAVFNFVIDSEQERIVKSLGEGPRLLRGLAGSGKTLVLLFRAKLKASNAETLEQPKKILILCWNITLANYMRQAFNNIKIPFNGIVSDKPVPRSIKPSIEIVHFVGWVRSMFERYSSELHLPPADQDNFLDVLTTQLKQLSLTDRAKYDAIYIDEAQDFWEEWIKYLTEHALLGENTKNKNLIIAADDAQRIYSHRGRKGFSWADLDIPMQGRARVLRRVYRNSARVWMFAGFFLGNIGSYYQEDDGKANASLWFAQKQGHDPELLRFATVSEQIEETLRTIRLISEQGYSARNILVLYPQKYCGGVNVPDLFQKRLRQLGLKCTWITENTYSKSSFDWSDESVKLSTVHSAKGMDAPVVIVLCADKFEGLDEQTEADKLMYVALTRAREYLKVMYSDETAITRRLENAQKEYNRRYDIVLSLERNSAQQIVI